MRRHKGKTSSHAIANSLHHKVLSTAQEEVLLDHIHKPTTRGLPPTPQIVENLVVEIVGHEIGEHWVYRFCKRYEERIKSVYLRGLDRTRQIADNSVYLDHFYQMLRSRSRFHLP